MAHKCARNRRLLNRAKGRISQREDPGGPGLESWPGLFLAGWLWTSPPTFLTNPVLFIGSMPSQCLPLMECYEVQVGTEYVLVDLTLFTTSSFSQGPVLAGGKGISPARLPQVHSMTANLSLPQKLLLPWERAWSPRPRSGLHCTASWTAGGGEAGRKGKWEWRGCAHLGWINGRVVEQALGAAWTAGLERHISQHLWEPWSAFQMFVSVLCTSSSSSLTALLPNGPRSLPHSYSYFLLRNTHLSLSNFLQSSIVGEADGQGWMRETISVGKAIKVF